MNVQFEEEDNSQKHFRSRAVLGVPVTPTIISAIIKTGIVKNEQTAGRFLIGVTLVSIILAIFITTLTFKPERVKYNLTEEMIQALPTEAQQKIYESRK